MENRTEFNLENNIKEWKTTLTQKNNLTKSNILELENHLVDLVSDLQSKGLNAEESFIIARKRIGKIDDICLEFDKVNTDFTLIKKSIPYLKGALIYIAIIALSKMLLLTTFFLSDKLNITNSTFTIISIILLTSILTSLFILIYFRKSLLNKLNKINTLITLIIVSLLITTLYHSFPLRGIGYSFDLRDYAAMELNFSIYKTFVGFVLLTMSLIFFWKNKKYNKLKLVK